MTDLLEQSAEVWSPSYPRRCAGTSVEGWKQVSAYDPNELIHNLKRVEGDHPGYVSTYAFPDGHPTDDPCNVPEIDTLMIDFDVEIDKENFDPDERDEKLSELLKRLRKIANVLVDTGYDKYWRASLSGFKGGHLYLDFPKIRKDLGNADQYHNGMEDFTDFVVEVFKKETGIEDLEEYIDVSSGWDLSRLTRLPNTIHEKATEHLGEQRYCVPVSVEELQSVNVHTYNALTKYPRDIPEGCKRTANPRTTEVVERYITTAKKEETTNRSASVKSSEKYDHYVNNVVNESVDLEDVHFLLKRKPCVWDFMVNVGKFNHGNASHIMEMQCIKAMESIGTPIEVMHEFFAFHPTRDQHPKYDEEETEKRIREVLSRDYKEFNCSSILEDAPQFCRKQGCKLYQDSKDLQRIH